MVGRHELSAQRPSSAIAPFTRPSECSPTGSGYRRVAGSEDTETTSVDDGDMDADDDGSQWPRSSRVDHAYLGLPRFPRFWRGVLFQMILFGALSFVGPAMGDAISNLGGGGLSTPYLANLANALNYASGCLVTLLGGPLINKLGIKRACLVAAATMPLDPSAYYASARHGHAADAYLLASSLLSGLSGGFLYVAETSAMLSYPRPEDRGIYLGIWSAMRSTGSVLGGAINFATSYTRDAAGGIPWSTYLVFVGFACTGLVWALLLSPTARVRRCDGCPVPVAEGHVLWAGEFAALWTHVRRREMWLVFVPAFYSFFYGGTMGTYLSLHFSVRARALSSLVVPSVTIPLVIAFGRMLDQTRWSQRTRAWIGFCAWIVPQAACFIWTGLEYAKWGTSQPALDYGHDIAAWAEAYLPYLIIFTTGYWTQLSLYWILGTFSTDVQSSSRTGGLFRAFETLGQAVSYAANSHDRIDIRIPFYLNCAILALTIPCMVGLIRLVPEPRKRI